MDTEQYVDLIESARVYDVARETPLELAENLSRRLGNTVLMKREDLQPVYSFKLRGAYNKVASLPDAAIRASVFPSGLKPRLASKRTPRRVRRGSSRKLREVQGRSLRRSRSESPPVGSSISPPAPL